MTEIETTAKTEGRNYLGIAVDWVQDMITPKSDAYTTQLGLNGAINIFSLPHLGIGSSYVDYSSIKDMKEEPKSKESGWTPHTIEELFNRDTSVTNLDIVDEAGNILYKSKEIPLPSDTSMHKFHLAKNVYEKLKNNESVSVSQLKLYNEFKTDLSRINEEARNMKDQVFIKGVEEDGSFTEEIQNAGFLWFNKDYALAQNRKQLDDFVSLVMVGKDGKKGGELNNLLLRRFLRDNFQTANPLLEAGRRLQDFGTGAADLLFPLRQAYLFDFMRTVPKSKGLKDFWVKWEAGKDNRAQLKKMYMNQWQNTGFTLDQTIAFNSWIKDRWLENNDIKDWENVREELTLEPEQVRQLAEFSTKEMGWIATIAAFGMENTLGSFGVVGMGKGLKNFATGNWLGRAPSNAREFLEMEKKKLVYSGKDGVPVFAASTVGDFAAFLATQEKHRTNVFNMWWKMLSWPQTRQLSRLESGRINVGQGTKALEKIKKINNSNSPWTPNKSVIQEYNDAKKELLNLLGNPNKLPTNDFKIKMAQAEKKLDKVTDHYIVELHKVGATSNRMTSLQMKRIFGDEVTPAVAQGIAFNLFEDTENAEMIGALANITTALGFHKGLVRGGDSIVGLFPYVNEGVYNLKGWLDETLTNPYLSKLGFKGFLDADISKLKIDDVPLSVNEYNAMIQFQNRMKQLGPEVVEFLDKQHATVQKQYKDILKIIPDNSPNKAALAENLRFSFSQMAQITYFAALGRKLLMQINHSDITKMNPRFQESLKNWMDEQKLIDAQSIVLDDISRMISELPPEAYEGATRLTDFVNKQRDALKIMDVDLKHHKTTLEEQYRLLLDWVANADNWKTIPDKDLEKIINTTFDAEDILTPELIEDRIRAAFPKQLTKNITTTIKRFSKSRGKLTDALNSGIKKLDKTVMYSFSDPAIKEGVLQDLAKATASNYQIQKLFTSRRMDEIYKPLDNIVNDAGQPIEIPANSLFHKILAHDMTSVGDENLLARFAKHSSFSKSTEGKSFFKATNDSSRRALIKHMLFDDIDSKTINQKVIESINVKLERDGLNPLDLNTPYEQIPPALLWNEANLMVNKMIAKDIHKINKRWSKEAGTEPSDLQAYMYYFETLKKSERPMAEIGLTLRELEDFRVYARDRTAFLKIRDPNSIYINGWMDMNTIVDKAIQKEAPNITVKLPNGSETDGLSYLEWTRTSYELEVANRRIPNSFYDAYVKALNEDPYAPTRIKGERGTVTIDGETVEFDIPMFKDNQKLLDTALGQQFLKNVFNKKVTAATREENLRGFKEQVLRQWGEIKYPKWASLARKGGTYSDLNPEIFKLNSIKKLPEYNEWVASFKPSSETLNDLEKNQELLSFLKGKMKNKLRTETDYVIDLDTQVGQEAMKLVENTYGILINELRMSGNLYGQVLNENNIDQMVFKTKPSGKSMGYNMNSFLTQKIGNSNTFKAAQELLILPVIKGGKETDYMVKNLDVIMAAETDIRTLIQKSEKARTHYNVEMRKLKHKINQGKILSQSQHELADDWREGFIKFLNIEKSKDLVETVFGGEQGKTAHDWKVIKRDLGVYTSNLIATEKLKMKNQLAVMKNKGVRKSDGSGWRKATRQELKNAEWWADDKNVENEINRSMRSFLWEGIRSYSGVVTKPVKGMNNQIVNTQTMANPEVAMVMLERNEVQEIFKEFGVDDAHMDAMLGITGHQVIMKMYYEMDSGNFNINDPRLTDGGIISRAFNYTRGMVSKEYLAVEAGFRVMRDRNLRLMNWLMNDKEAAVLINDMLNKPDTFDDWQASTLYERMSSYIIRELGHRGETVSEWFLETEIANQIETIEDEVTTENNEVTENNNNAI